MSVIFSGVVASKKYLKASNLDKKHGSTKNMACRIRCNSDGRDGVCCMIVYSFDLRESVEMIFLRIDRLGGRIRGCPTNPNTVLDEPFVDSFGRVCHEDTAFEIGLCENIWQRSSMVDMETVGESA
jgi:hypothetical protein